MLVLGRAADAEVLLRAIESGAVNKICPVGILSPSPSDRSQSIRGMPVLGHPDDLGNVVADLANRGTNVTRLVLTASALAPDAQPEAILMRARRLGLATSRLPSLDDGGEALRLAPVNVEDLLLRPSVKIDYRRLEKFVKGKAVVVTGGGGSIGAEICDRVVTFGAARLLVIENSEPALHAVLEALAAKDATAKIDRAPRRYPRPRAHLPPDGGVQARHRVPCRRAQARAAARAGLGRGRQDQRVRLGQCRRCGGGGRRDRDGDDLDRQGDRAGLGAGRHQAVCGDVLPGARRRACAQGGRPVACRCG